MVSLKQASQEIHEDVEALKAQLAEKDRWYAELEQHIDKVYEKADKLIQLAKLPKES